MTTTHWPSPGPRREGPLCTAESQKNEANAAGSGLRERGQREDSGGDRTLRRGEDRGGPGTALCLEGSWWN